MFPLHSAPQLPGSSTASQAAAPEQVYVPARQLFLSLQPGLEHMQSGLVASGMRFVHPDLVSDGLAVT